MNTPRTKLTSVVLGSMCVIITPMAAISGPIDEHLEAIPTCITPHEGVTDALTVPSTDKQQVAQVTPAALPTVIDDVPDTTPTTQVIQLQSPDGLVSLEGVIIRFDESLITIETSFGVVGVETLGLECVGAACPPELLGSTEPPV